MDTEVMTEPRGLDLDLNYEGTGRDLRLMIARHAHADEERFGAIGDACRGRQMTADEFEAQRTACHASTYGWAVVALLSMLDERAPGLAHEAACVVEDLGVNGGGDWGEDVYRQVRAEYETEATK